MNPWLWVGVFSLLSFVSGMLCSNLALTTFRAELLGWQKRRQARKLNLAMAEKIAAPQLMTDLHARTASRIASEPGAEGPFILEGGLQANRTLLIHFTSRLHAEDRRRFFLHGDQEKN